MAEAIGILEGLDRITVGLSGELLKLFGVDPAGILAQLLLEGLPALLLRELLVPQHHQLRRPRTVLEVHLVVHLLHEDDLRRRVLPCRLRAPLPLTP
jgi:hypothetical protein